MAADLEKGGRGQDWDAACYARNARFVSDLGEPVVDLLAPRPGERILDLGCGDGALTGRLAARGASVVAVDASPDMVAAARARGLDARVERGEALPFAAEFDGVFTNAALHWMRPAPVVAGVARALRPGGRFAGEFGGRGNIAVIVEALSEALARRAIDARAVDPWYFPDADSFAALLAGHGFEVRRVELFDRPTPLPTGIRGWIATFAGPFLAAVPAGERDRVLDEVERAVAGRLRRPDGSWFADYVRLRFLAVKTQ